MQIRILCLGSSLSAVKRVPNQSKNGRLFMFFWKMLQKETSSSLRNFGKEILNLMEYLNVKFEIKIKLKNGKIVKLNIHK